MAWTDADRRFMREALEEASLAMQSDEIPVGCVLVRGGEVVARGRNATNRTRNGTRHCEYEATDALLACHGGDAAAAAFHECDLYVTCEPCVMCAGALSILGIRRVVFGCPNDKFGGNGSVWAAHDEPCGECGPPGRGEPRSAEPVVGEHASTGGRAGSRGALPPPGPYPSVGGLMAEEAVRLLQQFYAAGNPRAPKPHRPVKERTGGIVATGACMIVER